MTLRWRPFTILLWLLEQVGDAVLHDNVEPVLPLPQLIHEILAAFPAAFSSAQGVALIAPEAVEKRRAVALRDPHGLGRSEEPESLLPAFDPGVEKEKPRYSGGQEGNGAAVGCVQEIVDEEGAVLLPGKPARKHELPDIVEPDCKTRFPVRGAERLKRLDPCLVIQHDGRERNEHEAAA